MYIKISIGLVGAMIVGHCLIQMRSGGAVSPPQGPRLVSGGGIGANPPESPKILHLHCQKWSKTTRLPMKSYCWEGIEFIQLVSHSNIF